MCSVTQSCLTFCNSMDCSLPGFSAHGDSPGRNTGVGYHFLLQGIFPTQRSNPGPLYCSFFTVWDTREDKMCAIYSIKNKVNIVIMFHEDRWLLIDGGQDWKLFRSVGIYCCNSRYMRIFLNLLFLLISNLIPLSLETYFVRFLFFEIYWDILFFHPASADLFWWMFQMLWKKMYTVKLLDVVLYKY